MCFRSNEAEEGHTEAGWVDEDKEGRSVHLQIRWWHVLRLHTAGLKHVSTDHYICHSSRATQSVGSVGVDIHVCVCSEWMTSVRICPVSF